MPENSRSNASGRVTVFFTGLAIGVALGILFAPKSGKETRNVLVEKSEKLMEMGKESVSDVVGKAKDLVESGKQKIEEIKVAGK
ncbi:MAG: YtxH domain-containing protein [Candidatus Humimicrobiaceae bacterium]